MQTLKTGTKIEMHGKAASPAMGFPGVKAEAATIARWTKVSGPYRPGFHVVRFQSGGRLIVHQDAFRVV